jgi:hypothetical protein
MWRAPCGAEISDDHAGIVDSCRDGADRAGVINRSERRARRPCLPTDAEHKTYRQQYSECDHDNALHYKPPVGTDSSTPKRLASVSPGDEIISYLVFPPEVRRKW